MNTNLKQPVMTIKPKKVGLVNNLALWVNNNHFEGESCIQDDILGMVATGKSYEAIVEHVKDKISDSFMDEYEYPYYEFMHTAEKLGIDIEEVCDETMSGIAAQHELQQDWERGLGI